MDITLYRLSTCHKCDSVEQFLRENNLSPTIIVVDMLDRDSQEKVLSEVYRLTGQRSFPVTLIDGHPVIGFDENALRRTLKLQPVEGPKRLSVRVIKERFAREEIDTIFSWVKGIAETYGCMVNPEEQVLSDIIRGLLDNERRFGYRSCPCRLASGIYQRDADIICPCAYCGWDLELYGRCYCALYVTERHIAGDTSLPEYLVDTRETVTHIEVPKEAPSDALRFVIRIGSYSIIDRTQIKNEVRQFIDTLGLKIERERWKDGYGVVSGKDTDGKDVLYKVEEGMDVYTHEIWFTGRTKFSFPRPPMIDASIFVYNSISTAMREDLGEKERFGSKVGNVSLYSVFRSGRLEGDRIAIIAAPSKVSEDALERLVEQIIKLENCYYLLKGERQKYILASDRINQLEISLVGKIGSINLNLPKASPDDLKDWLYTLSESYGEVSSLAEELRHYLTATTTRIDVIRNILREWDDKSAESLPPLSVFYREATLSLGDDYQRLSMRIDGIRREMTDLITILRTRVDLITQEQSLELQKSMDETAKTQVELQKTVEGLSIIVLTYYIVSISKFLFEGLRYLGLHIPEPVATALLVPIAFLISIALTWKVKEKLFGRKDRH